MRVVRQDEDDGCVPSVRAVRLTLDRPLSEADVRMLAAGHDLQYHANFERPLFKIHSRRRFVAQGVVGSCTLRLTLLPEGDDQTVRAIQHTLEAGCTP